MQCEMDLGFSQPGLETIRIQGNGSGQFHQGSRFITEGKIKGRLLRQG